MEFNKFEWAEAERINSRDENGMYLGCVTLLCALREFTQSKLVESKLERSQNSVAVMVKRVRWCLQ